MQSCTDCIPCFVRQAQETLKRIIADDDALSHRTLQRVLREAADFPLEQTPPAMAQTIHRIIREETGNLDPYAEIKTESTRIALELAPKAREIIDASDDPFTMALRFSIAGNIMDFALMSIWDDFETGNFIESTAGQLLNDSGVRNLREAVEKAETILILGDNVGEAVFDKLFIEQLKNKRVIYAVKGAPVINDVTLQDARDSGLDEVAELVENGSDAPGTILDDCPETFRDLFDRVDLVIAKGQANYETLSTCQRPLFFLTRIKCPVIGTHIGEPVGSWVVKEHKGILS